MRTRRTVARIASAVLVSLLLVVLAAPSAMADDNDNGEGSASASGSSGFGGPSVILTVTYGGGYVRGPGAPEWVWSCRFYSGTEGDLAQLVNAPGIYIDPEAFEVSEDNVWGAMVCPDSPATLGWTPTWDGQRLVGPWRAGERPPQAVIDFQVARAYADVEIPIQLGQSDPYGTEDYFMVTQMPTWNWIDETVWQPRSATTPPLFGMTATVTATPVNVTFATNDTNRNANNFVDCGANEAPHYDKSKLASEQHSDCTITYHHSSTVGDWTYTSTITWEASFTCSQWCTGGTLPPYVVENTRPVLVGEIIAVNTPPVGFDPNTYQPDED